MNAKQIQRPRAVSDRLGVAVSTLYDWTSPSSPRFNPGFPKKIKLGRRAIGFDSAEISAWIAMQTGGAQ